MTDIDYGKGGRLAEALARAQGEIKNPGKSALNPHFKAKYSTLSDGIDVIREALSKHGVAHVQTTRVDGGILFLTTALIHAVSGESLESEWPVGAYEKLTPQQMGSALTYARRYSLFALVGISGTDDDDDGEDASKGRGNSADHRSAAQSAELYRGEWESWVSNASDPLVIRERWGREGAMRRDLLDADQSRDLLKIVTDRLTQLGDGPRQ